MSDAPKDDPHLEEWEDHPMLQMDGYGDCLVGVVERFGQNPVLCYDKDKVLASLVADGMDETEAQEWFEFNQIGAWMGEYTPCFITTVTND